MYTEQSRYIAHEIRNHISICELYTEIIKKYLNHEGLKNKKVDNAIDCIKKSLKIMNNSLLDLKSLDNVNLEYFDLCQLINTAIRLSRVYGVANIAYDECTNINVLVDESRLLACLVNLLKNAIEAECTNIEITTAADADFAYIRVANDGKKISKEQKELIFNEGFTTKPTGSGLGLHICACNMRVQNAELKLLNSKQTVFEIKLPLRG